MDILSSPVSLVSASGVSTSIFSEILSRSPKTLLYFYPKDHTPGCTLEAQDFTRLKGTFVSAGIQIVGVSLDGTESHAKFRDSCGLGIDLISDNKVLHEAFSVIGEKKNYGKTFIGVIRSTFLLDVSGKILREWRNVKATGHAERVARELGVSG